MDAAFWTGFFGLCIACVTAIATHLKNISQDRASMKQAFRINTLEVQHAACEKERVRLLDQINTLLQLRSNGKADPK